MNVNHPLINLLAAAQLESQLHLIEMLLFARELAEKRSLLLRALLQRGNLCGTARHSRVAW